MFTELNITADPINEAKLAAARSLGGDVGAIVTFQGIVRDSEDGKRISGIEYEAFIEMARHQFALIFAEAEARWPIDAVHLVHRIGFVPINEPSLWVEVRSAHRGEAFAACQYIIDEMKKRVPIWKKPEPC